MKSRQTSAPSSFLTHGQFVMLKYTGTLFIRYTGALLPGHAPPPVQSPGTALNLPQRHLPARHAFLAALARHRAAATAFSPPTTAHEDDALRPCPTSRA